MYYPYFRGKQFELILIRDEAEFLTDNNIHPIIEPVKKDFKGLSRTIQTLSDRGGECTLIVNPNAGEKPISCQSILENVVDGSLKGIPNISLGYLLKPKTDIQELLNLLSQYQSQSFSLIHYGYTNGKKIADAIAQHKNIVRHIFIDPHAGKLYQRQFKKDGIDRILIRDGFKPQKKNSLYPLSEHFSELHITFPDEGMNGFGDFLIVGEDYSESGGPAWAIAIHLTYLAQDENMFIYHFISDQTDSPTNPGGKFLEALKKMVDEGSKPDTDIYKSRAYLKYIDLFNKQHYPGLGFAKKLSMQHHIELIAHFLNQNS